MRVAGIDNIGNCSTDYGSTRPLGVPSNFWSACRFVPPLKQLVPTDHLAVTRSPDRGNRRDQPLAAEHVPSSNGQFQYNPCPLSLSMCESPAYLDNIANVKSYTQSFGNSTYAVDDTLGSLFVQDDIRAERFRMAAHTTAVCAPTTNSTTWPWHY